MAMTAPIIVGLALREDDHAPLALARDLARFTGAPLALVNVYRHDVPSRIPTPEYDDMLRDDALARLSEAARPLRDGFDVSVHAQGSPSPVRGLHDAALALEASMVVVGSSHRSALGRVMPGGVGERLLHAAPCAVALAPRGYEAAGAGIHRIGVAFVDSPEGREALSAAVAMATLGDATLRAFTVLERPPIAHGARHWIPPEDYAPEPWVESAREDVRARLPEGFEAEISVTEGDAAKVLATASDELDMLVCGSRGYGPIRTVLLGGVSGRLAHMAMCPLLVLPRSSDREPAAQA